MRSEEINIKKDIVFEINSMNKSYAFDQLDETKIKCIKSNVAQMFCFNQSCKQSNPFYCDQKKCQCHDLHRKCQKGDVKFALNKIKQKIINVEEVKQFVDKKICSLIDMLSQFQQCLFQQIDKKFKFILFQKIQKQFYDLFRKQKQIQTISSQHLSELWQIINRQSRRYFSFNELFEQKMSKLTDSLTNVFEQLTSELEANAKDIQLDHGKLPLIEQSSIVTSNNAYGKLIDLFLPQKVNQLKLLFKASEWSFNIKNFYQICGHLKNLIIICQTQSNKIFGGYSEYHFNPQKDQTQDRIVLGYDQGTQKSFLFSLTQNRKFILEKDGQIITCYFDRNKCVEFTGSFFICDRANQVGQSYVSLDLDNYDFGQYKRQQKVLQKLVGSQGGLFKVKQWEVYQVYLKEKQKNQQKQQNC